MLWSFLNPTLIPVAAIGRVANAHEHFPSHQKVSIKYPFNPSRKYLSPFVALARLPFLTFILLKSLSQDNTVENRRTRRFKIKRLSSPLNIVSKQPPFSIFFNTTLYYLRDQYIGSCMILGILRFKELASSEVG